MPSPPARREHAAIAVTEGLLRRLTLREIAGVLAHEISHISNNDLRVMGLADALTRLAQAMSYVALFLAALNLIAGFNGEQVRVVVGGAGCSIWRRPLSSLLQLALSRTREFDADLDGAS